MQQLHVVINAPDDPSVMQATWVALVWCPHGGTSTPWRRACGNGCHLATPARAARCLQATPTTDLVIAAGVLRHGLRMRCGCDAEHWMRHGPEHHRYEDAAQIQPEETQVTGEALEELRESVALVRGPWNTDPWADDPRKIGG